MLRPVDTQTIYQQSHEVSNRQQAQLRGEMTQQDQFAHLLQKETAQKQEVVVEIKHDEKIDNQLDKNKKKNDQSSTRDRKKSKKKDELPKKQGSSTSPLHFDARI